MAHKEQSSLPPDSEFDLRARAELSLHFTPTDPPAALLRKPPAWWARRSFQGALGVLLAVGIGSAALLALRPQQLVREAIAHEVGERNLRGAFMGQDKLLQHLGLKGHARLPGFPQLMRPCEIGGRVAYHLTSFFEKGGMVTVFAFDPAVHLESDTGWWNDVYWQVARSRDGRPLVLVAQQKRALAVALRALHAEPAGG